MKKLSIILWVLGLIMIISGVIYEAIDFHNDYKCSTTTDIKWFTDNNCMRYMR